MLNYKEKNKKSQEKIKEKLEKVKKKKEKVERFTNFMADKEIKIDRLKECSNYLKFITNGARSIYKLSGGNFCNNRFCPVCSWLKAKKNAFKILELLEYARVKENKEFIFLTLTAPNVKGENLSVEITDFNESFRRLTKLKEFIPVSKGYIRKLEITYNKEKKTFHPHIHCIIAVNKSYFTSRDYIKREKWLELWKKSKRDNSITQVDVKKIKMDTIAEAMEIATYSTKQKDLYESKEIFDIFYKSLKARKIITFNGLFKELKKKQDRKELEIDDLKNLQEKKERATVELAYKWNLKEYEKISERDLTDFEEIENFYNFDLDFDFD